MDLKSILISIAIIGATAAAVLKFLLGEYKDVRKAFEDVKHLSGEKRERS